MNDKSDMGLAGVLRRFADSECSWLTYVRRSERTSAAPVWHLGHRGRIMIGTQVEPVKVRCVKVNPQVTVHLPDPPDPMDVAILEGDATVYEGSSLRDVVPDRPDSESPSREQAAEGEDSPTA